MLYEAKNSINVKEQSSSKVKTLQENDIHSNNKKAAKKHQTTNREKLKKKPEDITYGYNIRLKRKPWKSQNKV